MPIFQKLELLLMVCIEWFIPFSFYIYYLSAMKNSVLKCLKIAKSLGKLSLIPFCKLKNYKNGIKTRSFPSKNQQIKCSILQNFHHFKCSFMPLSLGPFKKLFLLLTTESSQQTLRAYRLLPEPWSNITQRWKERKSVGLQRGPSCAAKCGQCKKVYGGQGAETESDAAPQRLGQTQNLIHVSQILAQHHLSVGSMQPIAKKWSERISIAKLKNSSVLNCSSGKCNGKTSSCPVMGVSRSFFLRIFLSLWILK